MRKAVLIVRPEPKASELKKLLAQQHIPAYPLPLIQISRHPQINLLTTALNRLHSQDWIIAVSPNAVQYAHLQIQTENISWPQVHYAAIGNATAKQMHQYIQDKIWVPHSPQNSESLLSLPIIQQLDRGSCLILRGDTGRDLIKDQLTQQGLQVSYCATYKKTRTTRDINSFLCTKYQNIDSIIVTSGQQLEYLGEMVKKQLYSWLISRNLFLPSDRLKEKAKCMGFQSVYSIGSAENVDFLAALVEQISKHSGIK